jgi:tripartite-type tricarboxylate transporter receptor subunit TctC
MQNRRRFLTGTGAALCAAVGTFPRIASAQSDNRLLRIIVPYPPGGSTDSLARLIGGKLQGTYASSVIVENKPGAGGRIAMEYVKNVDPNSNTMVINSSSSFSVYPYVYRKLPYSPLTDFAPVSTLCDFEFAISAGPSLPATVKTLADLVQWVNASPKDRSQIGIPAMGTILHFTAFRVAEATGMKLTYVPYKGGLPVIQDVIGGHIPLGFNQVAEPAAYIKTGQLRVFGTSGPRRSLALPDIPTFKELGHDVESVEWFGLLLPAKAPAADVTRLNAAVRAALKTPEVRDVFQKLNFTVRGETPEEFAKLIRSDYEQWGPVVKATGFTVEE